MFLNKIDVPYCLVVFFVVCPRLGPFWSVFGELPLSWCVPLLRERKGANTFYGCEKVKITSWCNDLFMTVHLQQLKRMPRSELTRHAKVIPFVNENVYEENTLFCQKRSFDFLGIGHRHKEVTWPMLPLNNELESCWCQKLTELIKIILPAKFERKLI